MGALPPEVRLKTHRRVPPIWLMGLSNATLGLCMGLMIFVVPQLLAAEHVPEAKIVGLFATDAQIGIVACSVGWVLLRRYCPEGFGAGAEGVLAEVVGEEA